MSALTPEEIDAFIHDVVAGHGGPHGAAIRRRAIDQLHAHAAAAYPVVLVRAERDPDSPALLALLGGFDRPASIALLARVLAGGSADARREAGAQLGRASDPGAFTALLAALAPSGEPATLIGALLGLELHADPAAADSARPFLAHADPAVRHAANSALDRLRVSP